MRKVLFYCLIGFFLIDGCASAPVYKEVFKEKVNYNKREFNVSSEILYQAVVKAICSKSFIIENEDKERGFILAKRYFQKGKRNIILALQAKIVTEGEEYTNLYLNAVETTERLYVADRTRFFLFIIPLPGGGGKEATKIKEGEKIVEDKEFYQNFFSLIEEEIKSVTVENKEGKAIEVK